MSNQSESARLLAARAAAHESWAHTENRTARTFAARTAFLTNARLGVQPLASLEGRLLEADARIGALAATIDAQTD